LESRQHVLKMYIWSMSEDQASVQFKCRLIWSNIFSENMTLLFWYTRSVMTIYTCVFGTWHVCSKFRKKIWITYLFGTYSYCQNLVGAELNDFVIKK
jgi:hypothetical protein